MEDPNAEIERLYREHGSALLLFALAIIGDRGKAQDAVHQVFLKLIENGDLKRVSDKKAYLFACTRNTVLNERRIHVRHTVLDVDAAWFNPLDRDYAAEQNLQKGLAALPDDQRQTIVMHIWGELTFGQIGEVLGLSANTVASRYRYGLAKLRDSMFAKENCSANG